MTATRTPADNFGGTDIETQNRAFLDSPIFFLLFPGTFYCLSRLIA